MINSVKIANEDLLRRKLRILRNHKNNKHEIMKEKDNIILKQCTLKYIYLTNHIFNCLL